MRRWRLAREPYFKVGDLVYRTVSPVVCGKVLSVEPYTVGTFISHKVTWKRLNGEIKVDSELHLKNFSELLESHKRKAVKFEAVAKELEKL